MEPRVPMAVIGMSCRFAGGVDNPEKLWKLLAEGKSAWSKIPSSRFELDGIYHPNNDKTSTMNIRGGHFLTEDIALFDANFFNMPAEVAANMDPQYRMQLETTYEAFESAGLTLQDVAGSKTSVFGGGFFRDYAESHFRDPEMLPRFLLMGIGAAMASNRISHFYDLRGPSMTIDTGCSTTLTAFHQACQSLRTGESNMAVVGGANIIMNPDMFIIMSSLTLLSPEGKSFAFDHRASGYGRGEGSATILLKRLDDALRDGDPIRAVIRETGANQDGRTETITTPSGEAQEELIRECYRRAGLDPSQTTFFEAHGTGTPTGDPIEAKAIAAVFRDGRGQGEHRPLRLGSVKTNIGHTETASGLASIIKVTLALEKEKIPPNTNFERPNPKIDLDGWGLKVPTAIEDWPSSAGIRRASVNNFGYGGANAHVIMEDYASFVASASSSSNVNGTRTNGHSRNGLTSGVDEPTQISRVFVLSAKDEQGTKTMAAKLKQYLLDLDEARREDKQVLHSLAYTLGQRRTRFPWISAVPAQSLDGLVGLLDSGRTRPVRTGEKPRLGFVFTGQGAQWWGMGRQLIEAYPTFKASLLESEKYLVERGAPWSLIEELGRDAETTKVNDPILSMPTTVAIQIALVQLLESWGVTPTAIASHSSGEIAAAYTAGAIDQKSAIGVAFLRGQLVQEIGPKVDIKGGMMAVGLSPEDCEKYLARVSSGQLVAACMNSPTSTTISGDLPGIQELETLLQADGVFARKLRVDAAYHSHHMQFIAEPYEDWLKKYVDPKSPSDRKSDDLDVIFSSPTKGCRISSAKELCAPIHWVRSLVNPVRFVEAFQHMCFAEGQGQGQGAAPSVDMIVEIGPHGALGGPIQEILSQPEYQRQGQKIPYGTCLTRKMNAVDTMQSLACDLLRQGYPVSLSAVNFPTGGRDGLHVLHDLPHYPWNHQTRHWSEPRQNKALRSRKEAPHDLLGSLVLGVNRDKPCWKNLIKPADVPWVRDHVVQSNVVYPGAGFICMAIEGALQAADVSGEKVLGYRLRDVDILQALIIPEGSAGVEVQLELRSCSTKAIYAKGYKEFNVSSVSSDGDKWTVHCEGLISVEMSAGSSAIPSASSTDTSHASQREPEPADPSKLRMRVFPRDFYAGLRSVGINHGPIFQNLKTIRARPKPQQSVCVFATADSASTMPRQYQHSHVLHPTTLDTVFQTAYTAIPETRSRTRTAKVPRSIGSLWVSHDVATMPGHLFRSYAEVVRGDERSTETRIVVCNDKDHGEEEGSVGKSAREVRPLIKLDNFILQSLGQPADSASTAEATFEQEKLSVVKWAPDSTLMTPSYIKQQLSHPVTTDEADIIMDLRRVCLYYITDALDALSDADVAALEWHHKKFYVWMKAQADLAAQNKLATRSSEWRFDGLGKRDALIHKVNLASVNGEMVCRLGAQMLDVLRGKVTPLELMLEGKLLHRYYVEAIKWERSSRQIGRLVGFFAHKNPRAKILEIGAGTGGVTLHSLAALGKDDSGWGPLAASYDFTDISSGFFEAAKEKFADWESLVRYRKLDIEQDPDKQGFEEDVGTYDLVIASQVLHATKSMNHTMANVRRFLKPGGQLFIMESTQDLLDLQFVFGLLPGWWLSEEEERKSSPSLSIDMWNRVLRKTGFNGVECEVHDCEDEEFYSFSVIASTATPTSHAERTNENSEKDVILVTGESAPPESWIETLASSIAKHSGVKPGLESLLSTKTEGRICIFLGDMENSTLRRPDAAQFDALKMLCTKAKGILWVTRGGAMGFSDNQGINSSLSVGLLRSLREEYVGKLLVSLDLDPNRDPWSEESATPLVSIFKQAFLEPSHDKTSQYRDYEFAERDGVIQVPRYFKDVARNNAIWPELSPSSLSTALPANEPFHQPERGPLRLTIGTPGLLDTLAFTDDPDAGTELSPDQLEIAPRAFGVNFRDVMVAMGQLGAAMKTMCFECAGVVVRAGADASSQGFRPGDRVATLLEGHYGNLVRTPWTSAVAIPDSLAFETAASLPMAFATAYVALFDYTGLRKGESILIHAATGGVGQAAVMLAQMIGAEVFVTVGTDEKRRIVMEKFGLPADHIFSSRNDSFASAVHTMTRGRGVDVVLNSLAGALLQKSFDCLAMFGRFVEIGKRDLKVKSCLEMGTFDRSVSFFHIDLLKLEAYKGPEIQRIMKEIIRLFTEGRIKTVDPVTVYHLSEFEKTFRLMQTGKHVGKIVLTVDDNEMVPVRSAKPSARFRADASYLIIGGLGGIGRSVCSWMAESGAKHLIVLSRSANTEKAGPLTSELGDMGCKVKLVACDITNLDDLVRALWSCVGDMPPVRGVIQGAMVLHDSIFEQMTLQDYEGAIRPKVDGTWNLHAALEGLELDFFVMLSSLAGIIGFPSQSNYSAGGTFQDALAQYRVARGLPAASVDLGIVASVGYVAEHEGVAERLRKTGHTLLSEDDVLRAIGAAIAEPFAGQMMLGLNPGPGPHWEGPMGRDLRFASLRYRQMGRIGGASSTADGAGSAGSDLASAISAAAKFEDAAEAVVQGIVKKLKDIFMLSEGDVDPGKALSDYGVDSLVAVELRNMLALMAAAEVSIFDIMQSTSISALGGLVAAKSSRLDPVLLPSKA